MLDRIHEAGYTAKTDHLRRMVDYSRQVRLTRATPLDAANWLGRKLWWAGLLLQILWQAGVLGSFLLPLTPPHGTDDLGFNNDAIVDDSTAATASHRPEHKTAAALVVLQPLLRLLIFKANFLRSSCIVATLASCWWNPFFVQTVRGFTKPLIGIPTWYAYQATIVLVRLLLSKVSEYQGSFASATETDNVSALPPTVAGAHAVAAFFIFYLYTVAPRAIRKDVRPLFAKLPETPLTPQRASTKSAEQQQQHQRQQSENRRRGLETLSDVLDEISATPQRQTPMLSSPLARRDSDTDGWDGWRPSQNGFSRPQSQQTVGSLGGWQAAGRESSFSSLNLGGYGSTTPASQPALSWSQEQNYGQPGDADEMDWTPTQPSSQVPALSPHRAFSTYEPGASQFGQRPPSSAGAFSQTPVEADRGPFWYKVPPAPTSIAQRIFNRPNAPRLAQKTALGAGDDDRAGANASFGQNGNSPNGRQGRTLDLGFQGPAGASSSVEFAQPSFFAEDMRRKANKGGGGPGDGGQADNDDPGSFLSDLFSQTFTLSAGGGQGGGDEAGRASKTGPRQQRASSQRRRTAASSSVSSSTGDPSLFGRAASLMTTVASLAAVYCLQDIANGVGASSGAASGAGTGAGAGADAFVVQYVQPYARLIEASTVGLCAVLALSMTSESITRWRRAGARTARTTDGGAMLSAVVGLVLGLASLALAGWMATQMWAMLQAGHDGAGLSGQQQQQRPSWREPQQAVQEDNGETYGWLDNSFEQQKHLQQQEPTSPWQWWQLASLHGMVLAHQAWNMLVQ